MFGTIKKVFFIITLVTICMCQANHSYAASRNRTPGVNPDVARVMLLDTELRQGYDNVVESSLVDKPSGTAFLSCFANSAEITAKASSDIFSGDYSNQVLDPINDGLESIKDAFSFDNIVDYGASVAATAGVTVSLGIGVSAASSTTTTGNDKGPTVKGLSCGESQNKWMKVRDRGVKEYPSYKEKIQGANTGDTAFNDFWEDDTSDFDAKIAERESLTGTTATREILFEGPDIPFNDREDLCKILKALNLKGDCDPNEVNVVR